MWWWQVCGDRALIGSLEEWEHLPNLAGKVPLIFHSVQGLLRATACVCLCEREKERERKREREKERE